MYRRQIRAKMLGQLGTVTPTPPNHVRPFGKLASKRICVCETKSHQGTDYPSKLHKSINCMQMPADACAHTLVDIRWFTLGIRWPPIYIYICVYIHIYIYI